MPADDGEDVGVLSGDFQGTTAAVEIGGDGDDFSDAGSGCAFEDLGEFVGEIRVIEVSVGVVEGGHRRTSNIELQKRIKFRAKRSRCWRPGRHKRQTLKRREHD